MACNQSILGLVPNTRLDIFKCSQPKRTLVKFCKFIQYLLPSSSQYIKSFWILWLLLTYTQNFPSMAPTEKYFLRTVLTRLIRSGCWKTQIWRLCCVKLATQIIEHTQSCILHFLCFIFFFSCLFHHIIIPPSGEKAKLYNIGKALCGGLLMQYFMTESYDVVLQGSSSGGWDGLCNDHIPISP